jgi:hypothetical protein
MFKCQRSNIRYQICSKSLNSLSDKQKNQKTSAFSAANRCRRYAAQECRGAPDPGCRFAPPGANFLQPLRGASVQRFTILIRAVRLIAGGTPAFRQDLPIRALRLVAGEGACAPVRISRLGKLAELAKLARLSGLLPDRHLLLLKVRLDLADQVKRSRDDDQSARAQSLCKPDRIGDGLRFEDIVCRII